MTPGPADGGDRAPELTAGALAVLETLMTVVEAQDETLAGHSWRVGDLAASIASAMQWSDDAIEEIRTAGRLHDLGMVAVPRTVLRKAGPLTEQEFSLVRAHPEIGARIVRPLLSPDIHASIRGHHERWDGTGYPDRLAGEAIPAGARVLAAAEVFDALVSARSHRAALSETEALTRLGELAGSALDPAVVTATEAVVRSAGRLQFLHREEPGFAVEVELPPSPLPGPIDEIMDRVHRRR